MGVDRCVDTPSINTLLIQSQAQGRPQVGTARGPSCVACAGRSLATADANSGSAHEPECTLSALLGYGCVIDHLLYVSRQRWSFVRAALVL